MRPDENSLKIKTAHSVKWNTVDRLASQVLYAVTGVILANILSKEDFGLIGALLVFQAFATLFVDSGFGAALLQKKIPDQKDYSTVFWFNLAVSVVVYLILFFCAPLIADIFQNDRRLIPLSKVMFLSFVINGLAIVQTNRLMKNMNVKPIAVSNTLGLILSGAVGVILALTGFGAWALVWQSVTLATVKTIWLWCTGKWLPSLVFSKSSFRQIWRIGLSVFSSSFLNTVCLNIYSFVIGAFYSLTSLGIYTQADKWSKMGSASLSQILTASFVPLLSRVQDNGEEFKRYVNRINRFTALILFPAMIGCAVIGAPLFHTLFGNKWDAAIPLFQLLCIRGIFVVLSSLLNNYLLSLGYGRTLVYSEVIKDVLTLAAIFATVWFDSVTVLVVGQLIASILTYIPILFMTCRACGYSILKMVSGMKSFLFAAVVMAATASGVTILTNTPFLQLILQFFTGIVIYIGILSAFRSPELKFAYNYLRKKSIS